MAELNEQQQVLLDLLDTARADILAGRPAERTAYALETSLRCTRYTDMTDGTADDVTWREARGLRSRG